MQSWSLSTRLSGKKIGFVPTMGYLHKGHLSLIEKSRKDNDLTVASIFVNPTQFGKNEDFGKYPRDLERDKELLISEGCDLLFTPDESSIYPPGFQTYVNAEKITSILEGEFRPGHFKGVTTIVNILFNLVQPNNAYFGQKDAQQCAVIKRMVDDLKIPVRIVILPIVREEDGLAMSSRNKYLSPREREEALVLFKALSAAEELIRQGERDAKLIEEVMLSQLKKAASARPDYVRIVNSRSFEESEILKSGEEYFLLIACRIGATRLIDNLLLRV